MASPTYSHWSVFQIISDEVSNTTQRLGTVEASSATEAAAVARKMWPKVKLHIVRQGAQPVPSDRKPHGSLRLKSLDAEYASVLQDHQKLDKATASHLAIKLLQELGCTDTAAILQRVWAPK